MLNDKALRYWKYSNLYTGNKNWISTLNNNLLYIQTNKKSHGV